MPSDSTRQFYDDLAPSYHLIFADWRESVRRQGETLDRLLRSLGFDPPASILDCTCGIGTQAIGLGLRGYEVCGTDLSPGAVARAEKEAEGFGLTIDFRTADVRRLAREVERSFEVVLSGDNSLAHLLTESDWRLALRNICDVLKPGGLFLAGLRDYDLLLRDKPRVTLPAIHGTGEERYFSFQEWIWEDDRPVYTFNHFIVRQEGGAWRTECRQAQCRAATRAEVSRRLGETGFVEVAWHPTEKTGYYQPVVTARKKE